MSPRGNRDRAGLPPRDDAGWLTETVTTQPVARLSYRPGEIPALTGLSRAFVYQLITRGELRSVRLGRAILVPATALNELLQETAGERKGDGR